MVDAHSKWIEVEEMGDHAPASKTIETLRRIFSTHGLPQRIVSDNGSQFKSSEFQELHEMVWN